MTQLDYASPQPIRSNPFVADQENLYGILIALSIISVWIVSTVFLCGFTDLTTVPRWMVVLAMLWQTFLYTGLFITGHDAMHGVVFHKNRSINDFIGTLAVTFFALFSYKKLLKKHWMHHRHPATDLDPDFHDNHHRNFISWYLHFMKGYWSWTQIIGLALLFNVMKHAFHISEDNLMLFWAIPPILSSMQLFYFGTFQPHSEPEEGYTNQHRAQTVSRSVFWSLLTCYHFGYHLEHHEHPNVAWWQLPSVHKTRTEISISR